MYTYYYLIQLNMNIQQKYKKYQFSYKHYTEIAYEKAINILDIYEYIIKKEYEFDNDTKKTYVVIFITNFGNIICIDNQNTNRQQKEIIKFGYSAKINFGYFEYLAQVEQNRKRLLMKINHLNEDEQVKMLKSIEIKIETDSLSDRIIDKILSRTLIQQQYGHQSLQIIHKELQNLLEILS